MRHFLVFSATIALLVSISAAPPAARAQGCTGPDCAQQPGDGHQCEHEKKDEVTS